ncbi:MAG: ATP-binding protein, partial [Bacteroidota bacterium]|nr:ATP-binding protein [Bacteroidota bacterium]
QLAARYSDNKRPELCVIDNGPGIPEEILEQIFVPFFTTRENGSGIGLSLSRQIMRLHGGSLQVRSVPNKETVFCLRF